MSSSQPLVSIVTPVYNAEQFLPDTIKTVQDQTYENWEWLLVDDQSSDRSVEIIKEAAKSDERIKLIQLSKNGGAATARNVGTETSTGQYLAFLDADDLWIPHKLQAELEFVKDAGHAFVYSSYQFADESGKPVMSPVAVPVSINYRQALKNHIIWTSTVLLDTYQIDKDFILMPDVQRGQDTATWWQILRRTGKSAYGIQEPLAYYRRTDESLSANKLKAIKRTWYLLRSVEKLHLLTACYNFGWYAFNAVRKRV